MEYDYNRLIDGTLIPTTPAAVYTNSTGTAWIKTIILHNVGAAAGTVKLYDGANGTTTQFFNMELAVGETVILELPYPGIKKTGTEELQAECSVATTVNIRAFGGAE